MISDLRAFGREFTEPCHQCGFRPVGVAESANVLEGAPHFSWIVHK